MAEAMAVLGSVAAALQLVVQVKKAIDKVRQAPEIVKFIIQDLEVFESTLQFLKGTLKTMQSVADNTDKQKGKQRASLDWADQVQILRSIEPILKHCQTTCRNIQSTVAPFVQKARDTGRRKWIHAWTWTTSESKLKDLKWDLFSYKQSLHIGISLLAIHQSDSNTAQVLQQVHRLRQDLESADRRNYAGALADGTKPRVAMERFLSDTQTVVDAVNDPPPVYSSEGDMQSEVSGESENSDSESEAEYGQRATSEPSGWSPQYTPAAFEGKRITKSLLSDIFQRPVNIFIGGHQQQQSALSYGIIVHVTAGGLSKYNSTVQDEVDGASYKRNYVWWFVKKGTPLQEGNEESMPLLLFRRPRHLDNRVLTTCTIKLVVSDQPVDQLPTHHHPPYSLPLGIIDFDFSLLHPNYQRGSWSKWTRAYDEGALWLSLLPGRSSLELALTPWNSGPLEEQQVNLRRGEQEHSAVFAGYHISYLQPRLDLRVVPGLTYNQESEARRFGWALCGQ